VLPLAVLAPLFALVAACGGSEAGPAGPPPPSTPIAAYTLTTVDAKALPAVMFADTGYTLEVTQGTLTLTADLKYAGTVTTRETVDGNISYYLERASGSWAQSAGSGAITFTPTVGPAQPATWTATKLTVTQSDGVYQYTRVP